MSSIVEKNKIRLESRSKMFLRSNSFQRLCSLAHPMGLKGFKSNKEALKSVFESLIVTTRGVIQSVTYRILCFLFLAPFNRVVGRPLSILSGEDGKFSTIKLILKLTLSAIVSSDKEGDRCDKDAAVVVEETVLPKTVDSAMQTEDPAPEDGPPEEQFFDCKEHHTSSKPSTAELREQLLGKSHPPSPPPVTSLGSVSFGLLVYSCILGCFAQLSALVYLLNVSVRIPAGLIFLILALGYIGYVMIRIFLDEQSCSAGANVPPKPRPTRTTSCMALIPVTTPEPSKPKGIHPILAIVGKYLAPMLPRDSKLLVPINAGSLRTSRRSTPSRNRVLLCAHDKTISKMKIL